MKSESQKPWEPLLQFLAQLARVGCFLNIENDEGPLDALLAISLRTSVIMGGTGSNDAMPKIRKTVMHGQSQPIWSFLEALHPELRFCTDSDANASRTQTLPHTHRGVPSILQSRSHIMRAQAFPSLPIPSKGNWSD